MKHLQIAVSIAFLAGTLVPLHVLAEEPLQQQNGSGTAHSTNENGPNTELQDLIEQFQKGDKQQQELIIRSLISVGPAATPAMSVLFDVLGNQYLDEEAALAAIGSPAVPRLIEELTESDDSYRRWAARNALLMMGPEATAQIAASLERDSWATAYLLTTIPVLSEVVKGPSPRARRRAVVALGVLDRSLRNTGIQYDAAAIPLLIGALGDSDSGVQALAAYYLGARRCGEAVSALDTLLKQSDLHTAVQREVSLALFRVDRDQAELEKWREENDRRGEEVHYIDRGTSIDTNEIPIFEVTRNEIASDRDGYSHWSYEVRVEDSVFPLARRYERMDNDVNNDRTESTRYHAPPEGFDPDSLSIGWLDRDRLLCVQWTTMRNARIDVPADTTVLLQTDGDSWNEIFRSSVPGYNGYAMESKSTALRFDWNDRSQELHLTKVFRQSWGDSGPRPPGNRRPLTVYGDGQEYRECSYAVTCTWRCKRSEDKLLFEPGVTRLHLYTQEFPILEVAEFLRSDNWRIAEYLNGNGSGISVEQIRELNPWLSGEVRCTGSVVFREEVPPYEPDEAHRYLWASSK